MKQILFIALLCSIPAKYLAAQSQDAQLKKMMTKRALSQSDVALNIASLVPTLYKENKIDTIKQLIGYYERNYGSGYIVSPLKFLLEIKDREFKEEMKPPPFSAAEVSDSSFYAENILGTLYSFKELCSNMVEPGFYQEDVREQYIPYLSFIGTQAQLLKATPNLKPEEFFLLTYFAHPVDSCMNLLEDVKYNGTRVQRAWLHYRRQKEVVKGGSFGLVTGVWVPTGNLSLLGPHPYFGGVFGVRRPKFSVEINLNFRFLKSPNYYNVVAEQNLYKTNHYFGGYFGIDGMYQLIKKKKNGLELLGGVAFDGMDALKTNSKDEDAISKSINSLNLNMGVGYRLYIRQRNRVVRQWGQYKVENWTSYLAIQAKYNVINYKNAGGTPLNGDGITIGVIYGIYSRSENK